MLSGIVILQICLSVALLLVLWRFLSPIILEFVAVIDERQNRTTITDEEHFGATGEQKRLAKELEEKRREQRARGVKVREEIVEHMKKEAALAQKSATERAEKELQEFRAELSKLREKLSREVDEEAKQLSNVILQKVSVGSGMNPDAIH